MSSKSKIIFEATIKRIENCRSYVISFCGSCNWRPCTSVAVRLGRGQANIILHWSQKKRSALFSIETVGQLETHCSNFPCNEKIIPCIVRRCILALCILCRLTDAEWNELCITSGVKDKVWVTIWQRSATFKIATEPQPRWQFSGWKKFGSSFSSAEAICLIRKTVCQAMF